MLSTGYPQEGCILIKFSAKKPLRSLLISMLKIEKKLKGMMAQNINNVNLKKFFFLNEIAQKAQLQFCDIHVGTGLYRPRFEK